MIDFLAGFSYPEFILADQNELFPVFVHSSIGILFVTLFSNGTIFVLFFRTLLK